MSYYLHEIVEKLGGRLIGDGHIIIKEVGTLSKAQTGAIAFLANPKYKNQLAFTHASAVILSEDYLDLLTTSGIVTDNPYLYFAKLTQLLHPAPIPVAGVHPSATVSALSHIAKTAQIGPGAVIEDGVTIGENSIIGAKTVIQTGSIVGDDCLIHANVTIYPRVTIGNRCIF